MKKIAAVLLLSTAVAAPAFAAGNGLYAGVDLGRSSTSTPAVATIGASTKSTDTVFGALLGYQFNQNVGVEAKFAGAGKFSTASTSAKADAFGVSVVGTMPMNDTLGLYGKLGYARTKSSVTSLVAGVTGATRGAATYGLGLQYNVSSAIGVRFGLDRYGAAITSAGAKQNYNSNVWSVGAVFKF